MLIPNKHKIADHSAGWVVELDGLIQPGDLVKK